MAEAAVPPVRKLAQRCCAEQPCGYSRSGPPRFHSFTRAGGRRDQWSHVTPAIVPSHATPAADAPGLVGRRCVKPGAFPASPLGRTTRGQALAPAEDLRVPAEEPAGSRPFLRVVGATARCCPGRARTSLAWPAGWAANLEDAVPEAHAAARGVDGACDPGAECALARCRGGIEARQPPPGSALPFGGGPRVAGVAGGAAGARADLAAADDALDNLLLDGAIRPLGPCPCPLNDLPLAVGEDALLCHVHPALEHFVQIEGLEHVVQPRPSSAPTRMC